MQGDAVPVDWGRPQHRERNEKRKKFQRLGGGVGVCGYMS